MGYIADKNHAQKLSEYITEFIRNIGFEFSITVDRDPFTLKFTFRDKSKDIAGFTLKQQINCCGLLISTKTWVDTNYQGQGIAQEMMLLKEELAKQSGYSAMIATVNISGNPAEKHILEKFGWKCDTTFINSRTKNTVGIFTKVL